MNYFDASALLPLIVTEPASLTMQAFRAQHAAAITISDLAAGEVAAALARLVRMKTFEPDGAAVRWEQFAHWLERDLSPCRVASADIACATGFVRRFELNLRMPDAIHAAICQRLGYSLVTLDTRLARAAAALGVDCVIPQQNASPFAKGTPVR